MLSIDWLNVTFNDDSDELVDFILKHLSERLGGVEFESSNGKHGYDSSYRSAGVLLARGGVSQRGTMLLSLSGSVSSYLQWYGISALLRSVIRQFAVKVRFTRIDIALDVSGEVWRNVDNPRKVYNRLLDGRIERVSMVQSWERAKDWICFPEHKEEQYKTDGFTMYVGSRTSERMLRIYRKKVRGRWSTRFEYELKERYSANVGYILLHGGSIYDAWAIATSNFFDLTGLIDGTAIIEGTVIPLRKLKHSSRWSWLLNISSALAEFQENYPGHFQEVLIEGRERLGYTPYGNTGVHFEDSKNASLFDAQFNLETTGSPYQIVGRSENQYLPDGYLS